MPGSDNRGRAHESSDGPGIPPGPDSEGSGVPLGGAHRGGTDNKRSHPLDPGWGNPWLQLLGAGRFFLFNQPWILAKVKITRYQSGHMSHDLFSSPYIPTNGAINSWFF